jgi:hypothetical protein
MAMAFVESSNLAANFEQARNKKVFCEILPTAWRYYRAVFSTNNKLKRHFVLTPRAEQFVYRKEAGGTGIHCSSCEDFLMTSSRTHSLCTPAFRKSVGDS